MTTPDISSVRILVMFDYVKGICPRASQENISDGVLLVRILVMFG